jgi:peptidyl-prolyl cis-trans isomerase C
MSTIQEVVLSEAAAPAWVNGVEITSQSIDEEREHHADDDDPPAAARCALVIRELLRQRAAALELLADGAVLDDATLDTLLERELVVPLPTPDDCERYYRNHAARFRRNDIVYASHILVAVTGRAPLALIRQKAEETLQQVLAAPESFEALARSVSNCPSAGVDGSLGQLLRGDSVPEFEGALFDSPDTGILPRLVKTRFGFHIVRVERRVAGEPVPFDTVQAEIARFLTECVQHKAMQQYVSILASQAKLEGIELGETNGPLVQ